MQESKTKSEVVMLQFRSQEQEQLFEQEIYSRLEAQLPVRVRFIDAWSTEIDWSNPKEILGDARAIILGGSGELYFEGDGSSDTTELFDAAQRNVRALIAYVVEHDFPTLGVCFGHQVLGDTIGVRVACDNAQSKTGSFEVVLTEDGERDKLFSQLPERFYAQYGHKDSLTEIPYDSVLLARGDACPYCAYRHKEHIYSVQFHPELTKDDLLERLRSRAEYVPTGTDMAERVHDSHESSQLLVNFVKYYTQ